MPLNSEFDPEAVRFQDGGIPIHFVIPSDESIRQLSRWMAEQIALSERVRQEKQLAPEPSSSTHTMIVMADGEVIYNKYPDKVVPPAIFG